MTTHNLPHFITVQLKADYKNGVIGVDFEDIGDLEDLIENVKDQEKYQIAAVGAATANLASANLAVAKQIATAAASSGTWGFNVGVALDVEGSRTKTNTSSTTSLASNLNADTIAMFTDNTMATHTTIKGSNVEANNLIIDTHDLNVLASQDTFNQEMDNKSINGSIAVTVYGAATGPSVSLGYGEQHNNIDSLTNNNSNLLATNMLLNVTNDATFKGATVRADNLDMFVGNDLNVESLRDEYSSNSNGYNISVGTSFGSDSDYAGKTTAEQKNLNNTVGVRTSSDIAGGNIGGGVNSGSTTSKQVVLTSITANNADITVGGNTNLKGSLIAAGYYDENGNFVDNGNLNLTTNTLTFSNLNSTSYSTNTSVGGGVSLNQNKQGETLPNASSVTYDASSGISYSKEKTLATIGAGNLTITDKENSDDTTKLNRNTDNLAKELYSGGVSSDVSATIDMRMFTEDGREQMAQEYKDMDENMKTIADTLPDAHSDNVLESGAGIVWNAVAMLSLDTLPSEQNNGGLLRNVPIWFGEHDNQFIVQGDNDSTKLYINGILNYGPEDAMKGGYNLIGSGSFQNAYNPSSGIAGDLIEALIDLLPLWQTGISKQIDETQNQSNWTDIYLHSQAHLIAQYNPNPDVDYHSFGAPMLSSTVNDIFNISLDDIEKNEGDIVGDPLIILTPWKIFTKPGHSTENYGASSGTNKEEVKQ